MVDVRAKGATAETKARDELRSLTGHKWERVPGSGALDPKHGLKGDLYVPGEKNLFCVEMKHYKECHINHSLISGKSPQLIEWWTQAVRQGEQVGKEPLLIFKHDRSKLYCAFKEFPEGDYRYIFVSTHGFEFYIATLEEYITNNKPKFIL
jgi:hypothetical protein